jgi:class 3 adenylate cyclase/tetratricopeptide (TPR) repeat protein
MRYLHLFLFLICFLISFVSANAQQRVLDSLLKIERTWLVEDTTRAKLLTQIARNYANIDPRKGTEYASQSITIAEKLADKRFLASAYSARGNNYLNIPDYPAALENYQKALAINEATGNIQGIANNYNNIGLVYAYVFDYPKALENYQKALLMVEKIGNKASMVNTLANIGNIHTELKDFPKAIEYFQNALPISESIGNGQSTAGILVNLGNVYTQLSDLPKALEYKKKALVINEKSGNKARIANNLSNIGNVYSKMLDYQQALGYQNRALSLYESIKDKKGIVETYSDISDIWLSQKDYKNALNYASQARTLANNLGVMAVESKALKNLSAIYEATGKYDSAYISFNSFIALRDSIDNVEKQKQVTKKTLQFEFSKTENALKQQQLITSAQLKEQILIATKQQQELTLKQNAVDIANKQQELQRLAYLKSQADLQYEQSQSQAKEERLVLAEKDRDLQATQVSLQQSQLLLQDNELRAQRVQQYLYLIGLFLLGLLSFFIFRNFKLQQKTNNIIQLEKQKSDDLLLNILPAEVASELKEKGHASAKLFDEVTVLFTDFVNFTKVSEHLSPQELVSELHFCFKVFDEIVEKHGLEKIKTIGDAYMAVSGLPMANGAHAHNAARAAIEIRQFIQARKQTNPDSFDIRIGLNSGAVVAGIVGVKKFAYDIWGDTVNTAARMESNSEPGKINISQSTFALINNDFTCIHRG